MQLLRAELNEHINIQLIHMRKKGDGKKSGYTLAEVLTVAMILVITGSVIAGVISSVLRGTNKSKISTAVSQNGNYALSVISDVIASSTDVANKLTDCAPTPPARSSIVLTRLDGASTTLSCQPDGSIASTSGALTVSLTDSSQVKVDSATCYFKCVLPANANIRYTAPIIEVGFTVSDIGASAVERKSSAQFKTSVILRNYTP